MGVYRIVRARPAKQCGFFHVNAFVPVFCFSFKEANYFSS